MKFSEHDYFRLLAPIADDSVPVGAIGVVLLILCEAPPKYEVEFPDQRGGNFGKLGTHTVDEGAMEEYVR